MSAADLRQDSKSYVRGLPALQAAFDALPAEMVAHIRPVLEQSADELVGFIKQNAPVSDLEAHPGELRDSVHKVDGRHGLEVIVTEDARDAKGNAYGAHVEWGHLKRGGGGHVAPQPHFWPSVSVARSHLIPRMLTAMTEALDAAVKKSG